MTKTKKQLRAEAVERLKAAKASKWNMSYAIVGHAYSPDEAIDTAIMLLTDDDSTISENDSTAERGMTNIEWLYEHDGYVNSFAKLMACLRGFATDEFTANEWLRQEHSNDDSTPEKVVSGSEPCVTPESCRQYVDQPKRSDTPGYESDSREKLEADANTVAIDYWHRERTWDDANDLKRDVIALLDRQSAITERKTTKRHELFCETCEAESDKQIAELTDERDNWKANCEDWKKHAMAAENACYETMLEREDYRKKFGKCLDYADAIHALMDDEGMA